MDSAEIKRLKLHHHQVESLTQTGTWELDINTKHLIWSDGVFRILGYKPQEFEISYEKAVKFIHPEDRDKAINLMEAAIHRGAEYNIEKKLISKSGEVIHVRSTASIYKDDSGKPVKFLGVVQDISQKSGSDFQAALDKLDKQFMEDSISFADSIEKVLEKYLRGIDNLFTDLNASVLAIEQNRLRNLMSPGLPSGLINSIEGLPIGMNQGSCGTAAFLKERVFVHDISKDERWEDYADLAKEFNFVACWSQPIFDKERKVIATFAIYFKTQEATKNFEESIFDRTAKLISLVLQNFKFVESISQSQERFIYINRATNNAIYDWDIANDSIFWGDSLARVFGHKIGNKKVTLQEWSSWIHPDDLDEVLQDIDIFLANHEESKWSYEYRFKDVNGRFAYVEDVGYLIRDNVGQPLRMIGALRDQTSVKLAEIKKEIQQKISHQFRMHNSLDSALNYSLKYLTEYSNFSLGEIWLVNEDQDCIRLMSKYARNQAGLDFYDFELQHEFKFGEGLPGEVWKNKKYLHWEDIDRRKEFKRRKSARKNGLFTAIAYPLFEDEKFLGAILFAKDSKIEDCSYEISNFQVLEKFLGEEIKRKQKEEELDLFFDSAPENLVIANQKGYFLRVNPSLCNLLGYSKEDLTSQPFMNFIHPEDLEATQKAYDEVISKNKHPKNFVVRFRTKRGEYKWISWNSSDKFGPDRLIFIYGRDVTDMIELQRTVDNATALARVGGWEINYLTEEHYWSPMTRQIHEVSEDFTPDLKEAINFYHPDFQDRVKKAVEKASQTAEPFDFEAKIITAKGAERWVRTIGKAEFEKEQCLRIYGSVQDIHDRKLAEERLKNISNNIPGVLFQYHLKPDGTDLVDFISEGSIEVFGFTPEECKQNINLIWKRIEVGGDLPEMKNSIVESAKTLAPWYFVWKYRHPNGMFRYHEGTGKPRKLVDGTIVWDSIVTDITELKDLEILAERTAELAKIGSWELDLTEGEQKVYWSPMTREILEVDADYDPSLSDGLKFYGDKSKAIIENAIGKLIKTGQEFDLELLIITGKGSEKWIRCIGQADRIGNKTSRIFGSYQDIDRQKKAELAVQESLQEREEILESIGDAFFAVDHDWIVTYWNKEAEQNLGKKRNEILNKNLWEEYGEAVNLRFYTEYHKAVELQQTVNFEEYFPPLEKWFEVSAYPSKKGLSVYFKDVTIRKTAEERIKESNERFEKVALATSDAIWDWDLQTGQSFRFGAGFEKQFGYSNKEANNIHGFWKKKVHPDDLHEILRSQEEALGHQEVNFWKEEYRFKKKSGDYAYVIDKGYIVRDDKGTAVRMIGATTDISDRKHYEESLIEINERLEKQARELKISNAELEQFAYVASHDLQEPLRMVSGFLTQLEKKYGGQLDEKAHQYIDFAVDGAKRMRQIILDLLDFSRIGKEEEEMVEVDLNEVVNEVCLLQRKQIKELNAEVLFDDLPSLLGHPTPMIQLFQNLISNALKYSDSKIPPKIVIKARELKKEWKFSVKDNGIGIEAPYFDKIFNIFQRLHNKTEYSGTGMGLAIVKKIIENQKGKIWLNSKKGKGTTFYFTIPKQ